VEENVAEDLVHVVDFEDKGLCEEASENEHVEENIDEELVQLVDFEEEG
jgi:hypothetical protein